MTCGGRGGCFMGRKKKVMNSAAIMKDESTVVKMDRLIARRFRAICDLRGKKPKEEIDRIIREWNEGNLEKAMKENGIELAGNCARSK